MTEIRDSTLKHQFLENPATLILVPSNFTTPPGTGRLLSHRDSPGMEEFLSDLAAGAAKPWLRRFILRCIPQGQRCCARPEGRSTEVSGVVPTAGGKRTVSAAAFNTLNVWDVESGNRIASFHADASILSRDVAGQVVVAGDFLGRVPSLRLEESKRHNHESRKAGYD